MHNALRLLRPLITFMSAAFFILLGFIIGAALKAALTWVDPVGAPPALNAPAPINVSSVVQTKEGGLNIATTSGRFGIGTQSPQARLHLETAGLTSSGYAFRMGGNGQFVVDSSGVIGGRLTVLENGNVGIGNNNPDAKLRVDGQIKIVDGTQGAGRVLTSDANGLASWQTAAASTGGLVIASEGTVSYAAADGTKYLYPYGRTFTSSETSAQLIMPRSVTLRRIIAKCDGNTLNSYLRLRVRQDGSDTSLTMSISAGNIAVMGSSGVEAAFFSGSQFSLQIISPATSGFCNLKWSVSEFL